jgi:hypothetical protein
MGELTQHTIAKVSGPAWVNRFAGNSCRFRGCSWLFPLMPTAN